MSDFFSVLIPKRFWKFFTEFILYMLSAALQYWKITLVLYVLVGLLISTLKIEHATWYVLSFLLLFPVAIATIIQLSRDFAEEPISEIPQFGELECVFISDKDHFEVNFTSKSLLANSKRRIDYLANSISIFGDGFFNYNFITYPKFYYYLISPQHLNNLIQKKVSQNYLSILQVTVNALNFKVDVKFNVNVDLYSNVKPFQDLEEIFSRVDLRSEKHLEAFIEDVSQFYKAVIAHGFLDMLLNGEHFEKAHQLIDENHKIINNALVRLREYVSDESIPKVNELEKFWECEFERYRGITFALSENFIQAVVHLFKAIKLNPYYPFSDYTAWKGETIKAYAIELSSSYSKISEELEDTELDKEDESEWKQLDYNMLSQVSKLEFPGAVSYISLITNILEQAEAESINKLVEEKLQTNFCESPMQNYIRGEVLKYLPKGTEKIEKLYIDRLGEIIQQFEKVIEIDDDFPLIHSKYGTMLLFKEFSQGTNNYDLSMIHFKKGLEFFSKFGFNMKNRSLKSNTPVLQAN